MDSLTETEDSLRGEQEVNLDEFVHHNQGHILSSNEGASIDHVAEGEVEGAQLILEAETFESHVSVWIFLGDSISGDVPSSLGVVVVREHESGSSVVEHVEVELNVLNEGVVHATRDLLGVNA